MNAKTDIVKAMLRSGIEDLFVPLQRDEGKTGLFETLDSLSEPDRRSVSGAISRKANATGRQLVSIAFARSSPAYQQDVRIFGCCRAFH